MFQIISYPKSASTQEHFVDWKCAICQESNPENNGGTVAHLGGEAHPIHFKCLKTSLTHRTICPSCRTELDSSFFAPNTVESTSTLGRNVLIECGAATIPLLIGAKIQSPLWIVLGGILAYQVTDSWEPSLKLEANTTNKFRQAIQKISKLSTDRAEHLQCNYQDATRLFEENLSELRKLHESIQNLPEELQNDTREILVQTMNENPELLRQIWAEANAKAKQQAELKNKFELRAKENNFLYWSVYLINKISLLAIVLQVGNIFLSTREAK